MTLRIETSSLIYRILGLVTIIVLLADLRAMTMCRGLGIMVLETAISDDLRVQHMTMVVKSRYPHRYLFTAIDVSKTALGRDMGLIDRLLRIDLSDLHMVLATTIEATIELRTMILGLLLLQRLHRMLIAAEEIMALHRVTLLITRTPPIQPLGNLSLHSRYMIRTNQIVQ
jgi:hypothetical protein